MSRARHGRMRGGTTLKFYEMLGFRVVLFRWFTDR
jgi:hypothetical protein